MVIKMCPSPPTLRSLLLTSGLSPTPNKRVSGSGFQPSPKSLSATSDTRPAVVAIVSKRLKNRKNIWEVSKKK